MKLSSNSDDEQISIENESSKFLSVLNNPFNSFGVEGNEIDYLQKLVCHKNGLFVLCVASTKLSDIEGVSAAGVSAEARRLTPALDAEILMEGISYSAENLPVSPLGIASPVVITKACLDLIELPAMVVDAGSFHSPKINSLVKVADLVAECISTGQAMSLEHVNYLFDKGYALGEELSSKLDYLVISECVPGGTSTALAVLTYLGYAAKNLLSSSLPNSNNTVREELLRSGLEHVVSRKQFVSNNSAENIEAMNALTHFGDPMQAFVSGMFIAASKSIPVILAGGSQMLTVWKISELIARDKKLEWKKENGLVASTKWVAFDPTAQVATLSKLLMAPFMVSCPDFRLSRYSGLRAYEEGNVKEGVGAGAAMALAYLVGYSPENIMQCIDESYEKLVPKMFA